MTLYAPVCYAPVCPAPLLRLRLLPGRGPRVGKVGRAVLLAAHVGDPAGDHPQRGGAAAAGRTLAAKHRDGPHPELLRPVGSDLVEQVPDPGVAEPLGELVLVGAARRRDGRRQVPGCLRPPVVHPAAAAVVGWSDGAITGLQLAIAKPDRISKLFAFGANSTLGGLKPDGARSTVFAAYAARCKIEYAELSPHPEKWPQLMDGLRAMWRSEPNFTNEKLASINAPTMISDGEYDEIIKPEHTRYMATAIPGAQLAIEPNTSHFAMLQNPAQFNKILLNFLLT